MTIYTCGDSHSRFTFHDISNVVPFHIGPITMHRMGRDILKFSDYKIPTDGPLISSFGEIDVRCHVHKQVLSGRDEDEVIESLVTNYMYALKMNSTVYSDILVMEVVPPAYSNMAKNNPDFPFEGTDEDRARICAKVNSRLKHHSDIFGFRMFELFADYADKNGMLDPSMSDGSVHIWSNDKIKEKIKSISHAA